MFTKCLGLRRHVTHGHPLTHLTVTVSTAKTLNIGTKASGGQLNSTLPKIPAGLTKATSNLLNHGK